MKKCCSECKQEKSLDLFYRDRRRKDGYCNKCKNCRRVSARNTYLKHRTKILKKNKEYADQNPERVRAIARRWARKQRQENPDQIQKHLRTWREQNRKVVRQYNRSYRQQNSAKVKELQRAWRKANPDRLTAHRARRRARVMAAQPSPESSIDKAKRLAVYTEAQRLRKNGYDVHVDHIIPLSRGGMDAWWNLQILSARENLSKGARLPSDIDP